MYVNIEILRLEMAEGTWGLMNKANAERCFESRPMKKLTFKISVIIAQYEIQIINHLWKTSFYMIIN